MIEVGIPKKYVLELDIDSKHICESDINRLGITKFLDNQLKYIDCSRIDKNGLRLMQTIGVPYTYENGKFAYGLEYALNNNLIDDGTYQEYISKAKNRHKANLKFETDNPPIIYDKKGKTKNARKSGVKRKAKEGTLEGFEKPKKVTAKQINADARANFLKGLKLNIK